MDLYLEKGHISYFINLYARDHQQMIFRKKENVFLRFSFMYVVVHFKSIFVANRENESTQCWDRYILKDFIVLNVVCEHLGF